MKNVEIQRIVTGNPTKIIKIMDDHGCILSILQLTGYRTEVNIDEIMETGSGICLQYEHIDFIHKEIKKFKKECEEYTEFQARLQAKSK
jgi:hypothetical protein